jgi:hydrogenase nickel incorporation protein HypA/HybF
VHELGIAESIVETVSQRLPGSKVTLVQLEIGALSGVVPDSVEFSFGLAAEGTPLEGAQLKITERAAECRCRDCGSEFQPDNPVLLCGCGSANVEVLAGQDLRIVSVQVA